MTTNHPAHGPVSLDRLAQLAKRNFCQTRGEVYVPFGDEVVSMAAELQERRKAGSAEPIYQWRERYEEGSLWDDCTKVQYDGFAKKTDCEVRILYTTPPAPVVPDEYRHLSELYHAQEKRLFKLAQRIKGPSFDKYAHSPSQAIDVLESAIFGDNKDACRAARLQAEPVSNHDELPLDYLQGHKDGLEWAAQLAEANHPQTGDWLYDDPIELARAIRKGPDMPEFKSVSVDEDDNFYSWFGRFWYENYQKNNYTTSAKQMLGTMAEFAYRAGRESAALAGNSPVTPDGWIPVSERKPNDKDFVWCWGYVSGWTESDGFEAYYDATRNKWWTVDDETVRKITHWMPLPAAPQQEVKSE
nr:MAG TPA: Protein of unknown function (DUF551) [Caudoviricetes sp.]